MNRPVEVWRSPLGDPAHAVIREVADPSRVDVTKLGPRGFVLPLESEGVTVAVAWVRLLDGTGWGTEEAAVAALDAAGA